jgi:hypothetical protein
MKVSIDILIMHKSPLEKKGDVMWAIVDELHYCFIFPYLIFSFSIRVTLAPALA